MYSEKWVMDSRSSQPLYLQIKDALKQRILDGDYAAHERLPSESELMKMFGVSRITVRQSLRDLHSDGLVFSVQGKGTFVSKPKAVQDVQRLQGFGEAMTPKGYETSTRVLFQDYTRPTQEVAEAFAINRGQRVYEVKRIRYLNREPISIDHSFFPEEIGARLEHHDLAQDIFPMLENQFRETLGHADLKIGAIAADDEHTRALNIEMNSPCLRINRVVFTSSGKPIDFEYLTYRGDAFQYQLKVDRN
ncbi:MAG: GntR family transcriptional regulator [Gammaproteobacteria bacterium]|jgi:GntR family transcriptional regulator